MNWERPGRWAAVIAAGMIVAAAPVRSAPAPVAGIYEYEVELTSEGKPSNKMAQKIWVKGPHIRRETDTPRGKQVVINNPDAMIMLIPGTNQAMKVPMPPGSKINPANSMFPDMGKVKQMKKAGKEKVGPYNAEIHEETQTMNRQGMPPGQVTTRFWIADGVPVPVKITNKTPKMLMSMTLKSAQPNAPVPDSMFELPKGTKIIDRPTQQMQPTAPPKTK